MTNRMLFPHRRTTTVLYPHPIELVSLTSLPDDFDFFVHSFPLRKLWANNQAYWKELAQYMLWEVAYFQVQSEYPQEFKLSKIPGLKSPAYYTRQAMQKRLKIVLAELRNPHYPPHIIWLQEVPEGTRAVLFFRENQGEPTLEVVKGTDPNGLVSDNDDNVFFTDRCKQERWYYLTLKNLPQDMSIHGYIIDNNQQHLQQQFVATHISGLTLIDANPIIIKCGIQMSTFRRLKPDDTKHKLRMEGLMKQKKLIARDKHCTEEHKICRICWKTPTKKN